MDSTSYAATKWGGGTKLLFRFFFIYFLLYCFFNFFDMTGLWTPPITWLGRSMKLFNKIPAYPNGSGDTTYNYLQLLFYLAIALGGSLVWTIIDRRRINYERLEYWFFVGLRYVLGFYMITYGFAKIFKSQFPFPYYAKLLEPVGQQSPMGLAWNFMGYSTGFNLFTGLAEASGGLLLLFRRTTTFGSLFSMTVLSNIVAMNFFYDIPVKLFSAHLLFMAILIALPDAERLVDFFFRGKTVQAASFYSPVYKRRWQRISRLALKGIFVFGLLGLMSYVSIEDSMDDGDRTPSAALEGIYAVDSVTANGNVVLPLITDSTRWRYFIIQGAYADVKTMTDKLTYYNLKTDTQNKTISLTDEKEDKMCTLQYSLPDSNHMVITGTLFKDLVNIRLTKKRVRDFRLVSRGFHWINEYPYNR